MPARITYEIEPGIPHNLGLYRLSGFSGRREQLVALHHWLVGESDRQAVAISGGQGNGKSTLAVAAAWSNIHHFPDGIIWVGAAGIGRFRLYDIVRTMDTLLGTTLTRTSEDRWGIGILEQLYKRHRLLILDELSGCTPEDIHTLVEIIGHLNEAGGHSRILLIERDVYPEIAELVKDQHLYLEGIRLEEMADFLRQRAAPSVQELVAGVLPDLHECTGGRPLNLRLTCGLLLDLPSWPEVRGFLRELPQRESGVRMASLAAFAVENFAAFWPQAGPFLDRLVSAAGGASYAALQQLFWADLGSPEELDATLHALSERALVEEDRFRQRILIQPAVRRYLAQGAVMLGEAWQRSYASYYYRWGRHYAEIPLNRWPEVDPEWGNIHQGADWCAGRVERIWQRDPLELVREPLEEHEKLAIPADQPVSRDDLRLTRNYAVTLAHYAFWRHPPGILRWLAAGTVAAYVLDDQRNYGWLLANIGRQLFFKGEVEAAMDWLQRALAVFAQQDLLSDLAYVHTDLGTSLRVLDRSREALKHLGLAFEAAVQMGDPQSLATAYINLGSAHYSLRNYEQAVELQRKALRIARRIPHDYLMASAFNNIGLALEGMERYQEAQSVYEQALAVFEQIGDLVGISTCYNNLGSVCYARQDYEQAVTWYERDLAISQQRGAWVDMAATLHNLGHVALERQNLEQAETYFHRSRELYDAFRLAEYVAEEDDMLEYVRSLARPG